MNGKSFSGIKNGRKIIEVAIKRTDTGWLVDIQPGGRGSKRLRKTFRTQAEAKSWEVWVKSNANSQADWMPEKKDLRRLDELAVIWYEHHGKELRAAEDTYKRIKAAINALKNPIASEFNSQIFAAYRSQRLDTGMSLNTVNREHAYIRAMFNELIRLKIWKRDNPLKDLRQFKVQENELSYLTKEQVTALLTELKKSTNPHVDLVSRICLATGARWSEAEQLQLTQVRDFQIQFSRTKTGKIRTIPITKKMQDEITSHKITQKMIGGIFSSCTGAFKEAIDRAEIQLPLGQLTHVLRHTFASHFMINGGNILVLQQILGHQDLKTTMRYAHFSPDHLETVIKLNPLNFQSTPLPD
ncbi:tyrosine-type recombinase/integrase [Alcaligenes faecalis]|uniref:phage integrase n=1 Tax=Alcaligenes faecalis TaxID=511 RepID=UPI00137BD179|nr:tyrosine-type recombinase/integrase [Alcaligenes faecalis]QHS35862.1 tyrosine-type recombinase/integrase [Alcaligenes faecalis]